MASEPTNADKAKRWFVRTLIGAALGGVGLAALGSALASGKEDPGEMALFFGLYGVPIGAAVPGLFFTWFLFLTMVGQTSEAVRGSSRPRKKKKGARRAHRDEDDDA